MSKILQNAVKITENGKISYLNSFNRHDYRSHTFSDGSTIYVDGGCCLANGGYYTRSNGPYDRPGKCEDWILLRDSPIEEIRVKLLWGHRGKDGKSPLKYAPFAELELDHLKAILVYKDKFHIPLADIQIEVINYWITIKENEIKPKN